MNIRRCSGSNVMHVFAKSEKFKILSDHGPCGSVLYLDTQMRESNSVKSSCIRKGGGGASLVWEAIFNANSRHCDSLDFKMVCNVPLKNKESDMKLHITPLI